MTAPTCGELSCDECNARTAALMAERDQLRAALALGQQNCDDAYDDLRAERRDAVLRAERAEADAERYRLVTLKQDAELAAERARLDWVFRNCKVFAADCTIHDREDLGVAMKEGAR